MKGIIDYWFSASLENLLEMHISRAHPGPSESEILEVEPKDLFF